jgi:hypothetical protein
MKLSTDVLGACALNRNRSLLEIHQRKSVLCEVEHLGSNQEFTKEDGFCSERRHHYRPSLQCKKFEGDVGLIWGFGSTSLRFERSEVAFIWTISKRHVYFNFKASPLIRNDHHITTLRPKIDEMRNRYATLPASKEAKNGITCENRDT